MVDTVSISAIILVVLSTIKIAFEFLRHQKVQMPCLQRFSQGRHRIFLIENVNLWPNPRPLLLTSKILRKAAKSLRDLVHGLSQVSDLAKSMEYSDFGG